MFKLKSVESEGGVVLEGSAIVSLNANRYNLEHEIFEEQGCESWNVKEGTEKWGKVA